uniref:Alpha amylase inhibitor n=1 Tax=Lablab purpureus TaxID=35936 RepID=A9X5U8_LABPU|nr:alpha amylase inhibitor precursor [Lablab purpureus]
MASFNFSIALCLFVVLLSHANANNLVSFTMKRFDEQNLILQRDAKVSSGTLRLTNVSAKGVPLAFSIGRAFYTTPIRVWDKSTGSVASWATSFTFNINAPNKATTADGLAFALVPVGAQPRTRAGYLGLFDTADNNSSVQTLAVEFDNHRNAWDPETYHIGIDVNSIKSIKTTSWNWANGQNARVLITYDDTTSLLVASLVHPSQQTSFILSERVDVTKVLPEWVSVGFSATTGNTSNYIQTNDVLSWSFASELPNSPDTDGLDLASFVLHEAI